MDAQRGVYRFGLLVVESRRGMGLAQVAGVGCWGMGSGTGWSGGSMMRGRSSPVSARAVKPAARTLLSAVNVMRVPTGWAAACSMTRSSSSARSIGCRLRPVRSAPGGRCKDQAAGVAGVEVEVVVRGAVATPRPTPRRRPAQPRPEVGRRSPRRHQRDAGRAGPHRSPAVFVSSARTAETFVLLRDLRDRLERSQGLAGCGRCEALMRVPGYDTGCSTTAGGVGFALSGVLWP